MEYAGSVIERSHSQGFSSKGVYPSAGNQSRSMAKAVMRNSATTKLGIARPTLVAVTLARSTLAPGRIPERIPSGIPISMLTRSPANATEKVTGMRSLISSAIVGPLG